MRPISTTEPLPPTDVGAADELEVLHHRGDAALDAAFAAHDALAAAESAPVYARGEWLRIWRAANPQWEPFAVEVRAAGGPRAVALLARRRRRGSTEVVLMGAGDCDVASVPAADDAAAAVLAGAVAAELTAIKGRWRAVFDQMPAGAAVARALAATLTCARVVDGDPVPFTELSGGREASSYLSRRFRKETRRRRRRLEEEHAVTVEFVSDPAAIAAAAAAITGLRRRRDHDLSRPSTLDTEAGSAFWHGVVDHFAASGRLELALLRAGGELAAYVISIVDARGDGSIAYRGWDGRIATQFSRFAPGQILDVAVFEHCLARPDVSIVDYGRGDQQQKTHYANSAYETVALHVWSSSWLRRYDAAVDAAVAALRDFKESHPGLERRWRTLKRTALRAGSR